MPALHLLTSLSLNHVHVWQFCTFFSDILFFIAKISSKNNLIEYFSSTLVQKNIKYNVFIVSFIFPLTVRLQKKEIYV